MDETAPYRGIFERDPIPYALRTRTSAFRIKIP